MESYKIGKGGGFHCHIPSSVRKCKKIPIFFALAMTSAFL